MNENTLSVLSVAHLLLASLSLYREAHEPKYINHHEVHSDKPMSGAGSPICKPGSVLVEKYETAN